MATVRIPTEEEGRKAREDTIQWYRTIPTWQLRLWLGQPEPEWMLQAMRAEIKRREAGD